MLSDCKNTKFEINIKNINRPSLQIWKSNITHLNKSWVKEKNLQKKLENILY